MKTVLYIFCLGIILLSGCSSFTPEPGRKTITFNDEWKFCRADVSGAEHPGFNDSAWQNVTLPHDWSIEEKFSPEWASGTAYLPGGIGWYRKTFSLDASYSSKNVYIYFDGAYKNSEVWINGHYLGKRPNGHIPFQYEITDFLIRDNENTVAVRVDHSDFADSRWYTGSGINRNVYIIITDPLHIDQWGVKFVSNTISNQKAQAAISVLVKNDRTSLENVSVKVGLFNKNKESLGENQTDIHIRQGEQLNTEISLQVDNPVFWSPDNPYLYELKVQIFNDGEIVDCQSVPVGIRDFSFDADKGFFLNGENIKLKGVCIHDDASVLGTAVPKEVWERRLKTLKDVGCNAIRMSHNPHADYLYDLCDELGFLVMDEAFDEWELGKNKWIKGRNTGTPGKDGYNKYFNEWAERDVKDMVRRNQNRPSVIMWSIGNEIDYPNDPYTNKIIDEGNNPQIYGRNYDPSLPEINELEPIAVNLARWVREVDTTRPVTAALASAVMSNLTKYPDYLDIVGYNYQEYLYGKDHEKYPGRVIYGSENGMSFEAWKVVEQNDYMSAQFLWTGVEYLGEAGSWPLCYNRIGLIDLAGNPKPEYYFRKSLWNEEPMIYIGTFDASLKTEPNPWTHKKGASEWNHEKGEIVGVNCFTNCEEVALFLNGKLLGKKYASDSLHGILSWKIPFEAGNLLAKAYNDGKEVAVCELQTNGKPVAVEANFAEEVLEQGKVSHLLIRVADEDGNTVFNSNNIITVQVDGAGSLLGIESGNVDGNTNYQSNSRNVNNGNLLAYIKSSKDAGEINIELTSPGLKSKLLKVKSK